MSEQDLMDAFETRLTALTRSYTDPAARPFDPLVTARTAMMSTTRAGVLEGRWPVGLDRRRAWLLVAAALVIAIAALALAVGTRPSPTVLPVSGPGRIVFVRGGDLCVIGTDGTNERRIADGRGDGVKDGYLTAAWSPDARRIAAVREGGGDVLAPHVDFFSAEGALAGSLDLEPGGPPVVAWSPDGTELAVAELSESSLNPSRVPGQRSVVDLLVVGTNGVVKRKLDLPPDAGPFVVEEGFDQLNHNGQLAWSPDGRWISLPSSVTGSGSWVIDPDRSELRRIAPWVIVTNPFGAKEWAPDGRRIAFVDGVGGIGVGCPSGCPPNSVWTVGPDDAQVTFLVGPAVDADPATVDELFAALAWSRDGQQLAIVAGRTIEADQATKRFRFTAALQRFDTRVGRLFPVTSGTIETRPEVVVSVVGDAVNGPIYWTPDSRRIFFLTIVPGLASPPLSVASIDSDGKGQSSIVVRDVRAYDIGFPD